MEDFMWFWGNMMWITEDMLKNWKSKEDLRGVNAEMEQERYSKVNEIRRETPMAK